MMILLHILGLPGEILVLMSVSVMLWLILDMLRITLTTSLVELVVGSQMINRCDAFNNDDVILFHFSCISNAKNFYACLYRL